MAELAFALAAIFAAGLAAVAGALMREVRTRRRYETRVASLLRAPSDGSNPPGDVSVAALESHVTTLNTELSLARTEERRLRTTLDHLQIGVVVTDRSGTLVMRNAAADRLLGPGITDAVATTALQEVLRDARAGADATKMVELFGPRRVVVLHGSSLASGAVAVIEDVTERRRIDAIRRDFVSNISHELRTPVGALAVLAETLSDSADDEDPATFRRLAGRIDLEAHRLTAMVDDLLSLASIEADDPTRHTDLGVAQVLKEAADRVEGSARTRGIAIEVEPPSSELVVHGDRRQLVSAVYNLLENAVKYSDKGDPVRLEASRSADAMTEIRVIDHGIGIPSHDRERIFERFYRVDRARARDTGGTGLGLAIVRHVAVNHGGEVHVESLEGQGSTFTLRLPLKEKMYG